MDLMLKDVRTALDLADEMKVPWMIGSAVHEMIRAARNNLTDNADYAEIGRWIEQNADIEL
jgi:3-hydroxyisobutyrate dehydrogenase-like beta-hydroxyacid dehydrogenase